MAKRWWWWLAGLTAIPLAVWGYDGLQTIWWVGSSDLEVEFLVTDAATGRPIEGAEIAVLTKGGFYREEDEKDFTLRTGPEGTARRVCHDSMCFGTRSGLGFTDTWSVHLPFWRYQAVATGFQRSEPVYLDSQEYVSQVQRVGPRASKLVVRLPLQKLRD